MAARSAADGAVRHAAANSSRTRSSVRGGFEAHRSSAVQGALERAPGTEQARLDRLRWHAHAAADVGEGKALVVVEPEDRSFAGRQALQRTLEPVERGRPIVVPGSRPTRGRQPSSGSTLTGISRTTRRRLPRIDDLRRVDDDPPEPGPEQGWIAQLRQAPRAWTKADWVASRRRARCRGSRGPSDRWTGGVPRPAARRRRDRLTGHARRARPRWRRDRSPPGRMSIVAVGRLVLTLHMTPRGRHRRGARAVGSDAATPSSHPAAPRRPARCRAHLLARRVLGELRAARLFAYHSSHEYKAKYRAGSHGFALAR